MIQTMKSEFDLEEGEFEEDKQAIEDKYYECIERYRPTFEMPTPLHDYDGKNNAEIEVMVENYCKSAN